MTLGVRQVMLGGTAVSIILGMAVGAAISFDDPTGVRLLGRDRVVLGVVTHLLPANAARNVATNGA